MSRRILVAPAAFLVGFFAIVLAGKGIAGYLVTGVGMNSVVPNGIFLQGLVLGALNGLLAMGLVLVYRTNRIINFAQGSLGAIAATMAAELYQRFHWPFFVSIFTGVVTAVLLGMVIEVLVIRRFAKAPRLILTVATIGVAQILGFLELIPESLNRGETLRTGFHTPWSVSFRFGGVTFRGDHIFVLVVTPLVIAALVWFLRSTGYGLAARAAADNDDRARLLGVRVKRVSLIVWAVAGALSAVTAVLEAPIKGFQFGALAGFTLLVRALAAAAIGRFESLPITFGAAVLITTAQQTLFFATGKSGITDGMLLFVVVIALLVQRRRIGRLEGGSSSWQAVAEVRPIPAELRGLPEIRLARYGLAALGLVTLCILPALLDTGQTAQVSVIMLYGMVGISLVILTGWAGNVSLGQWALVGVGGLVAQRLAQADNPLDFFLILLIAGLVGAVVAVAIGLPALRIRGLFLGVTTLAFAVAAGQWMFSDFGILVPTKTSIPRPMLFGVIDLAEERRFYFVCFAALLLTLWAGRNLRRTRAGRVLIGVRDNERQAQSLGVSVTRSKLSAFAVSGFLAALSGALYGYHQLHLRADLFPPETSILMFSMVVIGGMGSMNGALLGAIYIRGTQYFLPARFQLLVTGLGLLVLLLFLPGGLGQLFYNMRDAFLRWVAARRGIVVPSLLADKRQEDAALPVAHDLATSGAAS
ncbi:MAG TPA: ABC transporter permease [Acidimicrobiales bacterium]|nr:ABC transporter permease [Acidimicrobiales bacterium]